LLAIGERSKKHAQEPDELRDIHSAILLYIKSIESGTLRKRGGMAEKLLIGLFRVKGVIIN